MSDPTCTSIDGFEYPGKLDPMKLATAPGVLWFDCSTVDSHGRGCIKRRARYEQRQDDEVVVERVPVPIGILLADALNKLGSEYYGRLTAENLLKEEKRQVEYWIRDFKLVKNECYELQKELEWRREDSRDLEQAKREFEKMKNKIDRLTKALRKAKARNRPKRTPSGLARIT